MICRPSFALFAICALAVIFVGCDRPVGSTDTPKEVTGSQAATVPATVVEGSKEAAQIYLESELVKWMSGQPTKITMSGTDAEMIGAKPLSYKVLAVLPQGTANYRVNTTLTFESKAGTPTERVVAYFVMWNSQKKEWTAVRDYT